MKPRRRRLPTPGIQQSQAAVDHKKATLDVMISQIPDPATFGEIAELMGFSYEWVRVRLTTAPDLLYKFGRRYKVPKGVVEDFIRTIYS